MKIEFIPIDFNYIDFEGKSYIKLIGRTRQGKRICVIDSYEANFWAILNEGVSDKKIDEVRKKIEKIEVKLVSRTTNVLKTELHNKKFLGKDVKAIKIFITNHKDAHAVADEIGFEEIFKRREYDVPLISKYIIEKKVLPLNWHEVEGEILNNSLEFGGIDSVLDVDICIKANSIKKLEKQEIYEPKILAFDIETNEFEIGKGNVLMISLYGKNFKKVLTWKKCALKQDYVECFKTEGEMIKKFIEYVKSYGPDILAGYFSDGFDLPYLRAVAEKNKIKLAIGIDGSQPSFARGRIPSGKINGIVHIDLFRFIETAYSQYLQSETLSLNEVASELLNEKKHDFDFTKLSNMKEEDWRDFFSYNLQDSALTYKLAEKIWPDMFEFSQVMQEPLFDITRDKMSSHVDNYILHNLERFNEIAEKRPLDKEIGERRNREKYEGAYVFQPIPGLYENIGIFDFTSMHASIIVSYNLSKATLLEKKEKNCIESPEFELNKEKRNFYFSKEKGFFPLLLEEIVELRKKYKKELKEKPDAIKKARSNAFKLLANAYYGYLGFFGARYYSIESAATTLAFVRKFNKEIIEKVKQEGYEVIFGDTDSVGFVLDKKTKQQTFDFLKKLNSELPGIMELELEDFYKRGIWVTKRSGEFGAKKKYALINEQGKLKIRGFETVRRDWCGLARSLQNDVLRKILNEGNEKSSVKIVKETIERIKERKIDLKELMIRTQLKKPINEYLSISPHVVAAKKMEEQNIPVSQGMLIEYYISETNGKKSLVRDKVKLPNEKGLYNIEYYLDRQILPSVENILDVFGIKIKEIIDGKKQMNLGEF
ncbi:MAG: DNA-directed DNA polymerase [Nanoarchaeota archaeon]|nr:DNA-directed DNA polymerase [Nanoarchaeota archaeon]